MNTISIDDGNNSSRATDHVEATVNEEEAVQKLQELHHLLTQLYTSQDASSIGSVHNPTLLREIQMISDLVSQNNASEKMQLHMHNKYIMAKELSELDDAMKQERKGFAIMSSKYNRRVTKLQRKCDRLENELKETNRILQWSYKVKGGGGEHYSSATDTTVASTIHSLDGDECTAPSEIEIDYGNIKVLRAQDRLKNDECNDCKQSNEIESLRLEVEEWKEKYKQMEKVNDELVLKIGDVAVENGELLDKYLHLQEKFAEGNTTRDPSGSIEAMQSKVVHRRVSFDDHLASTGHSYESTTPSSRMESKLKKALVRIEDLQGENGALHRAMEESMEMVSGMKEVLQYFTHVQEENAKHSEEKLGALTNELDEAVQSKEEVTIAMHAMKVENKALDSELEKARAAEGYYEHALKELQIEKQALINERNEAYNHCDILQQEIDLFSYV